MNRKRQALALTWLAVACVVVFAVLAAWPPTVGGGSLSQVELSRSMDKLQAAERPYFYAWLGVDCVFALLYTVLFTWLLRWRAAGEASDRWSFAGRFLSWITALAILFDLAENAILWAAASTAATRVSPWLSSLVLLKWLSPAIVVLYFAAWRSARYVRGSRPAPVESSPSPGAVDMQPTTVEPDPSPAAGDPSTPALAGRCLCGAVTITVAGVHDPRVGACHCRMCQRWTGGLFLCFTAEAASVTVTGDVARYRSSAFAERAFCPRCGSHVWFNDVPEGGEPERYELMPGLFDAARTWPLRSEIYTDRAMASIRLLGDHRRKTRAEYEADNPFIEGDLE